MALTQVSTGGIKDATIATADIAADAVTGAKIADDAVGAEHIEQLDADLSFADSAKAKFGAGNDLQIYHDGSDSYIVDSGTGDLMIRSTDDLKLQNADGSESFLHCNDGGDVILYRAGTERLRTTAYGTKFTNGRIELPDESGHQFQCGASGDFLIEHDGSNTYLKNITGNTVLQNDAAVEITASSGGTKRFRFDSDGLKFGSDTAAENALDDYEEGTYTPSDASGNGITYTNDSTARYVKIGMLVYVQFDFTLTNCNNLTTQSAVFTLPFSLGHSYGSGVIGWTTLNKPCQIHVASGGAYLMDNDSDTSIYLKNSQLNNKRFIGNMHYVTTT